MKKLVAYYSRTGNMRFVAEKIAKQLDADLCEIVDKKNRQGKLNYLPAGRDAMKEKLTEIEVPKPIEGYDFVVVGSPVWAGKITPAIRTFLVSNDFSNKQVALFLSMGGEDPEKPLANVKETINVKTTEELAITEPFKNREEAEQRVAAWCNQIQKCG